MKKFENVRILKGIGGLYHVDTPFGIYFCKPKGLFRLENISPLAGDFVNIEVTHEQDREALITNILPRKNELVRPRVVNIDQAIIVFSAKNPKPNFDLLDRLTILAERHSLDVTIIFNKLDLGTVNIDIYKKIGYKVILTSVEKNTGIEELKEALNNKVSVFCGNSGVGKSSLINAIIGESVQEIGLVSGKGSGKHTTRASFLIKLQNGYLVDSPGFSSLKLDFSKEELKLYFKEFQGLGDCKFLDCSHLNEPGCEVKRNIQNTRYERYKTIYEELKNSERGY
ncbi:MAG: ribosome small subunit-dependent GTPase A [Defluviitaleaceae bacterium]|nr:ribosome small subunit-dependent GTPase A [Defluviitaleaceae bacterium]